VVVERVVQFAVGSKPDEGGPNDAVDGDMPGDDDAIVRLDHQAGRSRADRRLHQPASWRRRIVTKRGVDRAINPESTGHDRGNLIAELVGAADDDKPAATPARLDG